MQCNRKRPISVANVPTGSRHQERIRLIVKGTITRDFRPSAFSSINPTQGPDSRAKAVSHMASCTQNRYRYGMGIFNYEIVLLDIPFKEMLRA
jgi:hypothetical protein